MKEHLKQILQTSCLLAFAAALSTSTQAQTTWNGGGGDGEWNTALNWDNGVPAEGVAASIPSGNTVNYNLPMTATSFQTLSCIGSALNINTNGFVVAGGSGNSSIFFSASTSTRLTVNTNGALSVTSGGMTFTTNAAGVLAPGGSITLAGNLIAGVGGNSSSGGGQGFFTNNGGALTVSGLVVNNSGNNQSCRVVINDGTNNLGAVQVRRSALNPYGNPGPEGLLIYGGLVNATSIDVGASGANSYLTMLLAGGVLTNTGDFIVQQATAGRGSRFLQTGGLSVLNGVNLRGHSANNVIAVYSIIGGTNLISGLTLGTPAGTDTTGTIRFTNAAKVYIGSGGMSSIGTLNTKTIALNNGGIFGAQADWSGTEPILLAGGSFNAADLDGNAHSITISGAVSGAGALTKTGNGVLTLQANDTYSGNTFINAGTLALFGAGAIPSSPQISIASGATFDVSAVSGGYSLPATRTLYGFGTVAGAVTASSGSIINPGSNLVTGTLTFTASLTQTGGVTTHFDLPSVPGPGNDSIVISGDLNVSGNNTIEISGGGSPGSVHTLLTYGGSFNGSLASFTVSGASGSLSNNPTFKTIQFVVAAAVRGPTSVTWIGNSVNNDWDVLNRTNWSNSGVLDYFVNNDTVTFDSAGTAHPNVNIIGNVSPSSVTVNAAADYTFSGNGAIAGGTGLLKTNSGTLTILTTNSYTGDTLIKGGVLAVSTVAIGGVNSGLGAAGVGSSSLVLDSGTLSYLGVTATTDRGATLNSGGGTIRVTNSSSALTVSGTITGSGTLTKTGPGTLVFSGGNNYSGGTVVSNGVLQLSAATGAGSGTITNSGATLRVNGAIVVDNALNFNGNSTLELSGVSSGNVALRGGWSGNGTINVNFLTQNTGQTLSIGGEGSGGGAMWDFSGTINFGTNRGFARLNNNSSFNFGSSNATFNLGTGDLIFLQRNGGTTTYLGALIGGPDTKLSGRRNDVSGTSLYVIGGNNLSTTFEGMITNGTVAGSSTAAITKVGTGTLRLTGPNPYTGNTTVEGGTLQVDGSITVSPITVTTGTLSGNGTLGAPVVVNYGGTLAPGSSVGQLTINNSLQLDSGSTNVMQLDKANGTNDSIIGLTSISYGGTLTVNNLGGTLQAGDTFVLFTSSGGYGGAFEATNLPALTGNLVWDTSGLYVDGSIKVISAGGASFSYVAKNGSNIELSGSGGTAGATYYVLTSTNVALPLANWIPVETNTFDSNGNFGFTNAISPSVPKQFYLLQIPVP